MKVEGVQINRCFGRVFGEVFEDVSHISEVESCGGSSGFSVCAPVLSSVLAVTVLFSHVNVVCEVVCSNSDCECVDLQTFLSLSRKREACFVGSEEYRVFR